MQNIKPVGTSFYKDAVSKLDIGSQLEFKHEPMKVKDTEYPNCIKIYHEGEQVGSFAESEDLDSPQQRVLAGIKETKALHGEVIELITPTADDSFKATYKFNIKETVLFAKEKPTEFITGNKAEGLFKLEPSSDGILLKLHQQDTFEVMDTWNGKQIKHDHVAHAYTDMEGNPLISGSQYGKQFAKDFPREKIAKASGLKHGVSPTEVINQWEMSGEISRDFGSAMHMGLEYYFLYRDNGCFKLPNHNIINAIIKGCPVYGDTRQAFAEAMIANLELGHCGIIDLILVNEDNSISLYDYKFSYDIKKSLPSYNGQLNFYGELLEADGFTVRDLTILNFDGEWEKIPVSREPVIINTSANA